MTDIIVSWTPIYFVATAPTTLTSTMNKGVYHSVSPCGYPFSEISKRSGTSTLSMGLALLIGIILEYARL